MKILNDGTTFFENTPTIQTDELGNIIIMDDILYPIKGMSKDDCISIYVVQKNNSNTSRIIYYQTGNPGETFTLPATDGYISFCHIVLPNLNFFNSHPGQFTYYADETGKIYNQSGEVDIQLILEVNDSTLIRHMHNFFSVFHLRKCYISLCQKIFNAHAFDRCFKNNVDSQLIYKRDLVWAALNVIQYMIDFNQLAEAQRLLERINGCNGLCSSEDTGDKGCGCEQ